MLTDDGEGVAVGRQIINSQLKDTEKNWWGRELEDGKKGNLWQTQGLGSGKVSRGRRKLRRT